MIFHACEVFCVVYTHLFHSNMFTHMCTGTKRAGGHSHLNTHWGLSCFINCFPHPTQSIQSHLYKLTVIRKQTPGLNSDLSFYHFMWSLQGGAGKAETTKKHVREQHEMKHTLSFSISLSHTHTHTHTRTHTSKVIQLFCWVKWLVYKNPPFNFLL